MKTASEPQHRCFGTLLSEWLSHIPNELQRDAVGLWQISPVLTHDFGLTGSDLEHSLRLAIHGLLYAGALPVQGATSQGSWALREDLLAPGEAGVDCVVQYWHALGREPDVGDLWLALPSMMA
jgi:hypothetical protein